MGETRPRGRHLRRPQFDPKLYKIMRFTNRIQAGQLLAQKLLPYRDNAVVYALPRGGVEVAAEVARALQAPLELIISRKIGNHSNPEYAVCAVTETGPLICNEYERSNLDPTWLKQAERAERAEAKRRREVYMAGRKPISAKGKTAILVDDGVATGLTMRAAAAEVKAQQPKQLIIAAPVISRDAESELREYA